MSTFAVVAHRVTPTNTRLGAVALARPRRSHGSGRATSRSAGLTSCRPRRRRARPLGARAPRGAGRHRPERRRDLVAAHDKLATASALYGAGIAAPAHRPRRAVAPAAGARAALVLQAALRLVGRGRHPLRRRGGDRARARDSAERGVVRLDRRRSRRSSSRRAATTCASSSPAAASSALSARVAAPGEWRTNVALGARREPVDAAAEARRSRSPRPRRSAATSSASTCCRPTSGRWVVLEVNGAVDFNARYSLGEDVFAATRAPALDARRATVRVEPAAATCGRAARPGRAGAGAGTARTSGRRARAAAPP